MKIAKIRGMSDIRLKAWLAAIDELTEEYKSDSQEYLDCPLCSVSSALTCHTCLWLIIEGHSCSEYKWDGYKGVPSKWEAHYKEWKPYRIKMLGRWREIIEREIIRRKEV